ncbi:3D domain-containing protein [Alicyclobacillus acidoterrestris]|uniref:3D domain-containing protein n=1 Tax=Alicyclobacillus acidoterrestris (strain ATCC 49025 / DSM 3922 / CIP 106132 / NCIMB 13137 / GD3B) TaxID=1356854 RepID=A0A9E6ZS32_ALIAG|nr:3D domain-containing protein [Alicyclobacillus acidoterrestris]UNO50909.1 3D domain-containing protein [Alicyclobacillus acidoterrestris]
MVGAVAGILIPPAPQPPVTPTISDDTVSIIDTYKAPTHTKRKRKRKSHKHASKPRWVTYIATAYSPYEPGQGTITASGKPVEQGTTIAVDPNIIPLGSTVEVEFADGTTHTYIGEDTGGAIKGNHIDIFFWSQQQCINFGRQYVKVRILHYDWT